MSGNMVIEYPNSKLLQQLIRQKFKNDAKSMFKFTQFYYVLTQLNTKLIDFTRHRISSGKLNTYSTLSIKEVCYYVFSENKELHTMIMERLAILEKNI